MSWGKTSGLRTGLYGNAYLLLTLTALMWGGNAVAGRLAIGEISPMVLTTLRWIAVVLLMAVVARRKVAADWPQLRVRLPFVAALGALGFTAFNALFYVAAHSTAAINLGIIQGAVPVLVLLGALLFYGTPVRPIQILGVLVTLVGVAVIAARGEFARLTALEFNEGDLLMLFACLLYAGYTVALRSRPNVSGLAMFTVMAGAAFVTSLPLLALEIWLGQVRWPSLAGWGIVAFVTIFPSFLAQVFFMRGVELIGPGRAGVFVNLVPVFAAALGVMVLGEEFVWFHGLALAFVLLGIGLVNRSK